MYTFPIRIEGGRLSDAERHKIYGISRISLCQKESGKMGRDYLIRKRGIDVETIANFRLGYVPFNYDHPFAGRIVMPIFDDYADLIALSVRPIFEILQLPGDKSQVAVDVKPNGDRLDYLDEQGMPQSILRDQVIGVTDPEQKYWNESYPKGEALFGMHIAKYSIIKWGFAIVVEGQMDVFNMHAHGLTNTVGVLGGVFTPIHAMLLKRWTSQVAFIMDGDMAGRNHTQKAQEVMRIYDTLRIGSGAPQKAHMFDSCAVLMPNDVDPDSFLRLHGSYLMRSLIAEEMLKVNMVVPKGWSS